MPGEKLMAEDICFEADGAVEIEPWGVKGLFCEVGGELRNITYMQDGASKSGAAIFGSPAKKGAMFYVMFDNIPKGKEILSLAIRIIDEGVRNPFGDSTFSFAQLRWQFFTEAGWLDVDCTDITRSFLESGLVHLQIGVEGKARIMLGGEEGYAVRCILNEGDYDISPRLHSVTANIFKVRQKDSKVVIETFTGDKEILLKNQIGLQGYYTVYCDEDGEGVYRKYEPSDGGNRSGRYYETEASSDGILIRFDKNRYGMSPSRKLEAIRIVCCDTQSAELLAIGKVLGYENQLLEMTGFKHILPEDVCLLVETEGVDGASAFHFVPPEEDSAFGLRYRVITSSGQIVIEDAGYSEGGLIHIAACAVTEGTRGNIRSETSFEMTPTPENVHRTALRFRNALPASGGCTQESVEDLRLRFLEDLRAPVVAVTLDDYEHIAENTPGFCIHKVKAVADAERSVIRIAVQPYGEEKMPVLSLRYTKYIKEHIDRHRMIGTRVELVSPVYVPVDVRAVIYVHGYFSGAKEMIESWLTRELDGVSGEMPFGTVVSYNHLYKGLESLDCVEALYEFSVAPRDWQNARPEGPDIVLNDDALCYPGTFSLEIR
jgi:hypothetical protein